MNANHSRGGIYPDILFFSEKNKMFLGKNKIFFVKVLFFFKKVEGFGFPVFCVFCQCVKIS